MSGEKFKSFIFKVSLPFKTNFPLQYCGKLFPEGTKMRRHVNEVHEKVKQHMCNTCGKCFARKDKLK